MFLSIKILNDFFPEHETSFNMILHRPSDEVVFMCGIMLKKIMLRSFPLENSDTEIDHELLKDLIFKIDDKNPSISK